MLLHYRVAGSFTTVAMSPTGGDRYAGLDPRDNRSGPRSSSTSKRATRSRTSRSIRQARRARFIGGGRYADHRRPGRCGDRPRVDARRTPGRHRHHWPLGARGSGGSPNSGPVLSASPRMTTRPIPEYLLRHRQRAAGSGVGHERRRQWLHDAPVADLRSRGRARRDAPLLALVQERDCRSMTGSRSISRPTAAPLGSNSSRSGPGTFSRGFRWRRLLRCQVNLTARCGSASSRATRTRLGLPRRRSTTSRSGVSRARRPRSTPAPRLHRPLCASWR